MDGDTFHWLDVDRIGEELYDAHPEEDPYKVSFTRLRQLVEELDGFEEQSGHPVNERILEAIQQRWISEHADMVGDDYEPDDED